MKVNYLRRIGALMLAGLMITGVAFASTVEVQAQTQSKAQSQSRRRVIIPRRIHRPFGYRYWNRWHDPWGWRCDPWSPYGSRYRQYVFSDSEKAVNQGYKDGFKTGKSDGKKAKSYKPERSHYYHDAGFGNYAEVYRSGFASGYQEGYRVGQNERAS
jgi:hypothetical protein